MYVAPFPYYNVIVNLSLFVLSSLSLSNTIIIIIIFNFIYGMAFYNFKNKCVCVYFCNTTYQRAKESYRKKFQFWLKKCKLFVSIWFCTAHIQNDLHLFQRIYGYSRALSRRQLFLVNNNSLTDNHSTLNILLNKIVESI